MDRAEPGSLAFILADIGFHRSLMELAENRLLLSLFDGVMAKSLLLVGAAIHQSGPPELSASHKEIVEDLCRARPDEVYGLLKDFILAGKSEMQFRSFMGSISHKGDHGALASVISEMRKEQNGQ